MHFKQLLVKQFIVDYKIKNQLSIRKIAKLSDYDPSLIHGIFSGKTNNINTLIHVLSSINSQLICQGDAYEKLDNDISQYFKLLIWYKKEDAFALQQEIKSNESLYCNSTLIYRYKLYCLIQKIYAHKSITSKESKTIFTILKFLSDDDIKLYYDSLCVYYKNAENYSLALSYASKSLNTPGNEIYLALACFHQVKPLTMYSKYIDAFKAINVAYDLFNKYGIRARADAALQMMAIIHSKVNDYESALAINNQLLIKAKKEKDDKLLGHIYNNILWIYYKTGSTNSQFQLLTEMINENTYFPLSLISLAMLICYKNNNLVLYKQWRKLVCEASECSLIESNTVKMLNAIVDCQLEKASFIGQMIINSASRDEKDELIIVIDLMVDIYKALQNKNKIIEYQNMLIDNKDA